LHDFNIRLLVECRGNAQAKTGGGKRRGQHDASSH
jgi:hypothetical protein